MPLRLALLGLALAIPLAQAQGPLVVIGGGARTAAVMDTLLALAGGAHARIVVVPHASAEPDSAGTRLAAELRQRGAADVRVALGPPDGARGLLDGATAVFFAGGDQNRLAAALAGTAFLAEIRRLHAAGTVLAGTSAGAAVMSAVMITGDPLGDVRDRENPWDAVRAGRVATAPGFAFVTWGIVDQHFLARSRHNRLLSLVLETPALLGVGVDEATAVVVAADGTFGVVGDGAVLVYDAREAAGITTDADGDFAVEGVRLHLLVAGQRFDPAAGRVLRGGEPNVPAGVVPGPRRSHLRSDGGGSGCG